MPAPRDHDARRRDVSAAVWRVLAAGGFGGLTLRAVAAEMGASTGLLTHYFPTKQALVRHALEIAGEHTENRPLRTAEPGLAALHAALLDVLPLTAELTEMNKVWISFWDAALGDEELREREEDRYERWRSSLRPHVVAAQQRAELPAGDPDAIVAIVAAFAHGLIVQTIFAPATFPPERQAALLEQFLTRMRT